MTAIHRVVITALIFAIIVGIVVAIVMVFVVARKRSDQSNGRRASDHACQFVIATMATILGCCGFDAGNATIID